MKVFLMIVVSILFPAILHIRKIDRGFFYGFFIVEILLVIAFFTLAWGAAIMGYIILWVASLVKYIKIVD